MLSKYIEFGTQFFKVGLNLVSVVAVLFDLRKAPSFPTQEFPPSLSVPQRSVVDRVAVVDQNLLVLRNWPQTHHAHYAAEPRMEEGPESGIWLKGVANFVTWKDSLRKRLQLLRD